MEPGTPFYYYSQPASRDFFVSGADHSHSTYNSTSTSGGDYSSSYLGDQDCTKNNSFTSSVDTAPTSMYTGPYHQSSPPVQSLSTHSSPSISTGYAVVGQQQEQPQYEYHQNQYLIQPIPSSMDTTNLLPEDIKMGGTTSPSYHYPYSSSSSSTASSSTSTSSSTDLYALQSPTCSMDLLSHQHQQAHHPSV
jgi:hypothetical protein